MFLQSYIYHKYTKNLQCTIMEVLIGVLEYLLEQVLEYPRGSEYKTFNNKTPKNKTPQNKTPKATKRPMQQKAQLQNAQCYKTPNVT